MKNNLFALSVLINVILVILFLHQFAYLKGVQAGLAQANNELSILLEQGKIIIPQNDTQK